MSSLLRVLLIDDDPAAQLAIVQLLNRSGFEAHALGSPIGATRAIRDLGIEVVICDLDMPAMRGDAFAKMFRKTSLFSKMTLVILSAAGPEELDALRQSGTADGVINKANIESELLPLLRRLRPVA